MSIFLIFGGGVLVGLVLMDVTRWIGRDRDAHASEDDDDD